MSVLDKDEKRPAIFLGRLLKYPKSEISQIGEVVGLWGGEWDIVAWRGECYLGEQTPIEAPTPQNMSQSPNFTPKPTKIFYIQNYISFC